MFAILLAYFVETTGILRDETISGYADRDVIYALEEMFGEPVTWSAEIQFPEKGKVVGAGPCNRFFAKQGVPMPWVEIRQIAATKRACSDLAAEHQYFQALQNMSLAEIAGPFLILSDDDGQELVFQAKP